ncbi:MAG: Yip1 family protein, partial [Blastocatellia bacterium]
MSQPENQTPGNAPAYSAPQPQDRPVIEEPARLGPLERLTGTLLSPGETFADINRKPTWLAPMLIVLLVGLASSLFFEWRVKPDWDRFFRTQVTKALEKSGRTVPPEQIDQQVAMQVKFAKTDLSSPISILLLLVKMIVYVVFSCLVPAGIFALGLMMMQAKTTFKKILSVVSWSTAATGLVGAIVFIAVLMVREPESLRDINPTEITT